MKKGRGQIIQSHHIVCRKEEVRVIDIQSFKTRWLIKIYRIVIGPQNR